MTLFSHCSVHSPSRRCALLTREIVSNMQAQRPVLHFRSYILHMRLHRSVTSLYRNHQLQLRRVQQHQWIDPLIDCGAHENGNEAVGKRSNAFEVHAFNVHPAIEGLGRLIKTQLNCCLRPALKLHTVSHQDIAATKNKRGRNIAVDKLHCCLDSLSLSGQRHLIGAAALERSVFDICERRWRDWLCKVECWL